MNIKSLVKQVLVGKENRRYEKLLEERRTSYSEWIDGMEEEWERETLSRNPGGSADDMSCGAADGFVVFTAGGGVIAESALKNIARYFTENPEVQLLYGDEDVWNGISPKEECRADSKDRCLPWFKPDWSPDLLNSYFYFGSLVAMRKEFFEQVRRKEEGYAVGSCILGDCVERDGAESEGFGVQIFDVTDMSVYRKWILYCLDFAGGYRKGCKAVGHIPRILFHCESEAEQKKFLEMPGREPRGGMELTGESRLPGRELISIVIPSKDNPQLLEKCLEGCRLGAGEGEDACAYEIIVVDNGSEPGKKRRIAEVLKEFETRYGGGQEHFVTYLYEPMEFNFSRMCNLGAEAARGAYLLFLNDDVELCEKGCLGQMAALAGREYTGAVGMKLYYPDSVKMQHAGITNLPMGPVHKLQFLEDNRCYYFDANLGRRNVLAVTAACLMVEGKKFREVGGFSEELRVAFNDVDFCFGLYELGYQNVCINDIFAYHHESVSRGTDESAEKLRRLLAERDKLYSRHPGLLGEDPYYSPWLNREGLDTRIRPAYETGKNRVQEVNTSLEEFNITDHRRDACLMVRVEDFREGRAVGYGVVLGDNNACYEKKMLLGPSTEKTSNVIYAVTLEGQYRPDLAENMPDQVNVALCGYDVNLKPQVLPRGNYRIGMAVRNRVTGLKLVNWTNRYVEL